MLEVFRNMWRRKLRTSLTVFGIVIGVYALTVMGAMAEKTNTMISSGAKFYTAKIDINGKGGIGMGPQLIPISAIEKIGKIDGVKSVAKEVALQLSEKQNMVNFGMPDVIIGEDLSTSFFNKQWEKINKIKSGRNLKKSDHKVVVVGRDIAVNKKVKVGKMMKVRGESFKVVGILDKTLTAPDKMVYMPIADARRLFIKSQPYLRDLQKQADSAKKIPKATLARMPADSRKQLEAAITFKPENIVTGASVYWQSGADSEEVAKRINKNVADVNALSPKDMQKQLDNFSLVFNLIIMGSGFIALIVGGLSVINTMIMSVSERKREIGVKKAVGARTRDIMVEYLMEAGAIGLTGGLIGLGLGWLTANAFNARFASKGVEIFLVSQRLAVGTILFALILGIIAGIYPAAHAARLDPVKALRAE